MYSLSCTWFSGLVIYKIYCKRTLMHTTITWYVILFCQSGRRADSVECCWYIFIAIIAYLQNVWNLAGTLCIWLWSNGASASMDQTCA